MIAEPHRDHVVWLDGAFVPWRDAKMHLSDHHYGLGVFEGVRAYAGKNGTSIFRLQDHTARLFRSAHIMKIGIPDRYPPDVWNGVQREILRRNQLADAYLRPFVFLGGTMGLSLRTQDLTVHVAVMSLQWVDDGAYHKDDAALRGLSLRTATFARQSRSSLSKAKANGNYVTGILALQEARATGADEALMLDENGFATEASGANLFVVRQGSIWTTPVESVLDGVTRDTVMALASEAGWPVIERRMTREEIYVADEVFLTGTAAEITPVREFDGRRIGTGERGPITARIQSKYSALVRGLGEHHAEWLTPV